MLKLQNMLSRKANLVDVSHNLKNMCTCHLKATRCTLILISLVSISLIINMYIIPSDWLKLYTVTNYNENLSNPNP